MKRYVGKVGIQTFTKEVLINNLKSMLDEDYVYYVVTPYSEFIVMAENNRKFQRALDEADISIADGVGILWAGLYLNNNISFVKSLFYILTRNSELYQVFPEKISGSDLFYDILKIVDSSSRSIYLVGGTKEVSDKSKIKIENEYKNINLVGQYYDIIKENDKILFEKIYQSKAEIVILELSPPKQEIFANNLKKYLVGKKAKTIIFCFGGTLDFFIGEKLRAPILIQKIGLEWLWRLIIEPRRIKRIYTATFEYTKLILQYKNNPQVKDSKNMI